MKTIKPTLAILLTAAIAQTTTQAVTWTEAGDAGNNLFTAQTTVGIGPLTEIDGTLPSDSDLDLFLIQVTSYQTFAAVRNGAVAQSDPDIWLFDASGNGVTFNNTTQFSQTGITSTHLTANGLYYLGISNGGAVANSSGGAIWNTGVGGPFTGERAPDGPGTGSPLTTWSSYGVNNGTFSYTILLQGADFAVVPEPSALALLALGLFSLAARLRRP